MEAGLDVKGLPQNFTSHWDLSSAAFFCGTIITTIGRARCDPPRLGNVCVASSLPSSRNDRVI